VLHPAGGLHQIRDETDPQSRRRGPQVPHGTLTRWLEGCDCDRCREAQNDASRARFRRKAQERFPPDVRQQLLDAIYGGKPFRTALEDLGFQSSLGAHQDRRETVRAARGRPDGNAPRRCEARHQRRVRCGLRLQGVSEAPANPHGQEPLTSRPWSACLLRICDDLVLVENPRSLPRIGSRPVSLAHERRRRARY
jgi:hypothetical protein